MKLGVRKNIDYVLVPCPVWDLLFDLYGGGPPLPRMVDSTNIDAERPLLDSSEVSLSPIPDSLLVVTHPWIIHCQVRNNFLMCALFYLPENNLIYPSSALCPGMRSSSAISTRQRWFIDN